MSDVNTNEVVNETVEEVVETPVEEETKEEVTGSSSAVTMDEETGEVSGEEPVPTTDNVGTPEEKRELADEYSVNFTLSYAQYLAARGEDTLASDDAAKLIASLVGHYENEASAKDVRDFFEIPEALNDKIEAKFYNIGTEIVSNDSNYKVLLVRYTLRFGKRIVRETPKEDLVEVVTEAPVEATEVVSDDAVVDEVHTVETPVDDIVTETTEVPAEAEVEVAPTEEPVAEEVVEETPATETTEEVTE